MEILIKSGALMLVGCSAALVIRRTNPELSLAVSIAAVCCLLAMTIPLGASLKELCETARREYGVGEVYLLPLMKCCAAALLARLTADLCREASQAAAASAMELLGLLCAISSAMPLLRSMLEAIGEML